jgi:hypothetical protein
MLGERRPCKSIPVSSTASSPPPTRANSCPFGICWVTLRTLAWYGITRGVAMVSLTDLSGRDEHDQRGRCRVERARQMTL